MLYRGPFRNHICLSTKASVVDSECILVYSEGPSLAESPSRGSGAGVGIHGTYRYTFFAAYKWQWRIRIGMQEKDAVSQLTHISSYASSVDWITKCITTSECKGTA